MPTLPLDQTLNEIAPLLGLAILLVIGLAIVTGFAYAAFDEDEPRQAQAEQPSPRGGLGRRLEGDPAAAPRLYRQIGSEYVASRMRPCDAHWYTGRDFGDER